MPRRLAKAALAFLAPPLGLGALALLAGWYKFGGLRPALALLGGLLGLLVWGFRGLGSWLAPGLGPALVWGSLLGGAAQAALLTLLRPFTGLTWVLLPPYHHQVIFVLLALLGALALLKGPWAGRWPRAREGQALPGGGRLLLLAGGAGLLVVLALALGLEASLGPGGLAGPGVLGGIKGLAKNPRAVLWGLALAGGLGLGLAAWRPGRLLTVWLPGLGFGLLWARLGLETVAAMEPVLHLFSGEVLQLLFLTAATWLGLGLAAQEGPPAPPGA